MGENTPHKGDCQPRVTWGDWTCLAAGGPSSDRRVETPRVQLHSQTNKTCSLLLLECPFCPLQNPEMPNILPIVVSDPLLKND